MSAEEGTPAAKRFTRRRWLLNGSVVMVSLVVALVLCEVLCRIVVARRAPIRFRQDIDQLNYNGFRQVATILEPDSEMFWRLPRSRSLPHRAGMFFGTISNAKRLREDHEIPYRKRPGELRVLFLGDSCTFGFGVSVRDGYVEQAERKFRDRHSGTAVEFINAGVPGYSLFQGWRYWEVEGYRFQPDLVTVCFGYNDMYPWDNMSDLEHYEAQPMVGLRWSRLCQLLWQVFHQPKQQRRQRDMRPRLTPEEFAMLLTRLHESVQRQGSDLLLISWPTRHQLRPRKQQARTAHQQVLHDFSHANGVAMLDLVPVLQDLGRNYSDSEIYLDDVHTTALANAEVGKQIAAAVGDKYDSH